LSNTPHFRGPNGDDDSNNVNSENFGKVLSTDTGEFGSAGGRSREIRFGLRLSF